MKQKSGLIGVVYAAILSAIAGYFFRATQLSGSSSAVSYTHLTLPTTSRV